MKRLTGLVLALMMVGLMTLPVGAQGYPTQPITIIVGFGPGGATDVLARIVAKYSDKYLGQPMVINNMPGANTEISLVALKKAAPDGYTLCTINIPHALSNILMRQTQYTMEDFKYLANFVVDPGLIGVRADDDRFKTLDDLIKYAKANPGKTTWATSGIGSDDHIAANMFEVATGVKVRPVPYKSDAEITAAVLGGHVDVGGFNVGNVAEQVLAGKIRALGVMAEKRYPDLPDVPTLKEQGYDVISDSSRGIVAPKGLPDEIAQKLGDAFRKISQDPEFIEDMRKAVQPMDVKILDEYDEYMKALVKRFTDLYKVNPWGEKK